MLSIDNRVVNDDIRTFPLALMMLMASFYCFNIQYPQAASSSLEFFQRYDILLLAIFVTLTAFRYIVLQNN